RHRYHDLRNLRLQDLVQPAALRPFLQADVNPSRYPADRLQQRVTVRLHHPRGEPFASRPHDRQRAGLRMRIQPNVSIHASPPLRRTGETGPSRTGPTPRLYRSPSRGGRGERPPFLLCLQRIVGRLALSPTHSAPPPRSLVLVLEGASVRQFTFERFTVPQ